MNTSANVKIKYNTTFGTIHSKDYYKGKSFHYAGKWTSGAHYFSDDYNIDFIAKDGALLACAVSHYATSDNEPTEFLYNDNGEKIGIASRYWDFVLAGPRGIPGKTPGIRINPETGHWEICEDIYAEPQVWVDTGFGEYMPIAGGTFTGDVTFGAFATFINGAESQGNIDMSGFLLSNVGEPQNDTDAVNKAFMDFTINSYPASNITDSDIERWDTSSIWVNENKE